MVFGSSAIVEGGLYRAQLPQLGSVLSVKLNCILGASGQKYYTPVLHEENARRYHEM